MTVQELIDELMKVEDKSKEVVLYGLKFVGNIKYIAELSNHISASIIDKREIES